MLKALLTRPGTDTAGFFFVFVLYFVFVTAASAVIYNLVDRPFMNWRRRLLEKKEKKAEVVISGAGV